MLGIASLLRQELTPVTASVEELRLGFSALDTRLNDFMAVVNKRLQSVESRLDVSEVRIEKLENMIKNLVASRPDGAAPPQGAAQRTNMDKRHITAVIGNLDALSSMAEATTWLKDKLMVLKGPAPSNTYSKGAFKGILFAEFQGTAERDIAVDLLRAAGLQPGGGKGLWATPDRPAPERAARNFCFGLKRLFKNEWQLQYHVNISDEAPSLVTVGGEKAVMAHVEDNAVRDEWHGDWETWEELHNNQAVQDLLQKNTDMLPRASQGMKGSKGQGFKGGSKGGQTGPGPH